MRKVIPHTSGGVTYLSNKLQLIRTYGNPNKPFQSAELAERKALGIGESNKLWIQRVVPSDAEYQAAADALAEGVTVSSRVEVQEIDLSSIYQGSR